MSAYKRMFKMGNVWQGYLRGVFALPLLSFPTHHPTLGELNRIPPPSRAGTILNKKCLRGALPFFLIEGGLVGLHPPILVSPSPYKERGIKGVRLL